MIIRIRSKEIKPLLRKRRKSGTLATKAGSLIIPLPLTLFMNGLSAFIAARLINKYNTHFRVTSRDMYILFKAVKKSKKVLKKLKEPLVYISSRKGEEIIITL